MKITLALSNDGTNKTQETEVNAYKVNDSSLAVHKSTWLMKTGEIMQGKTWNISHIPSGVIILSGFSKRKYAIECGNELSLLADWSTITLENAGAWYLENKETMLKLKAGIQ